jgi:hypothetical protein
MKNVTLYQSPELSVTTLETDGTILSQSAENGPNMGMNDLTYEDIQWN